MASVEEYRQATKRKHHLVPMKPPWVACDHKKNYAPPAVVVVSDRCHLVINDMTSTVARILLEHAQKQHNADNQLERLPHALCHKWHFKGSYASSSLEQQTAFYFFKPLANVIATPFNNETRSI